MNRREFMKSGMLMSAATLIPSSWADLLSRYSEDITPLPVMGDIGFDGIIVFVDTTGPKNEVLWVLKLYPPDFVTSGHIHKEPFTADHLFTFYTDIDSFLDAYDGDAKIDAISGHDKVLGARVVYDKRFERIPNFTYLSRV